MKWHFKFIMYRWLFLFVALTLLISCDANYKFTRDGIFGPDGFICVHLVSSASTDMGRSFLESIAGECDPGGRQRRIEKEKRIKQK